VGEYSVLTCLGFAAVSPALSVCRSYRGLYILNWIYRYMTESHYRHQWAGEEEGCGRWVSVCASLLPCWSCELSLLLRAFLLLAVWLSGTVQTAIYCDFFYYYIRAWKNNEKLALPA
jgi:ER lumen protein retaining receptor